MEGAAQIRRLVRVGLRVRLLPSPPGIGGGATARPAEDGASAPSPRRPPALRRGRMRTRGLWTSKRSALVGRSPGRRGRGVEPAMRGTKNGAHDAPEPQDRPFRLRIGDRTGEHGARRLHEDALEAGRRGAAVGPAGPRPPGSRPSPHSALRTSSTSGGVRRRLAGRGRFRVHGHDQRLAGTREAHVELATRFGQLLVGRTARELGAVGRLRARRSAESARGAHPPLLRDGERPADRHHPRRRRPQPRPSASPRRGNASSEPPRARARRARRNRTSPPEACRFPRARRRSRPTPRRGTPVPSKHGWS